MTGVKRKTKPNNRVCVLSIALAIAFGSVSAPVARLSAQDRKASGAEVTSRRMADGKQWTTHNLNIGPVASYCYADAERNCRQYGRLYTWVSARRACQLLGGGWRLPADDEWRKLAKQYGGVSEDSDEGGRAAYKALLIGGGSEFNAQLGGGRAEDGQYARLEAHGFYWTASESEPGSASFYNFARGGLALHRQSGGEKQRAFSVRCVRE